MVSSEAVLDALGSPTRRAIVRALQEGDVSVGALAAQLPISRPAVSQQLRILEDAALVRHEKQGTKNVYRLDQTGFSVARSWLDAFWSEGLSRFAALAEDTWRKDA